MVLLWWGLLLLSKIALKLVLLLCDALDFAAAVTELVFRWWWKFGWVYLDL